MTTFLVELTTPYVPLDTARHGLDVVWIQATVTDTRQLDGLHHAFSSACHAARVRSVGRTVLDRSFVPVHRTRSPSRYTFSPDTVLLRGSYHTVLALHTEQLRTRQFCVRMIRSLRLFLRNHRAKAYYQPPFHFWFGLVAHRSALRGHSGSMADCSSPPTVAAYSTTVSPASHAVHQRIAVFLCRTTVLRTPPVRLTAHHILRTNRAQRFAFQTTPDYHDTPASRGSLRRSFGLVRHATVFTVSV